MFSQGTKWHGTEQERAYEARVLSSTSVSVQREPGLFGNLFLEFRALEGIVDND